jgi:hypothetical protein
MVVNFNFMAVKKSNDCCRVFVKRLVSSAETFLMKKKELVGFSYKKV